MSLTRNVVRSGVTRDVTWDLSNGEFYGGVTPTLHYDFVTDKSLVARTGPTLSITRATSATYRDNTGTIQTASSGAARFDHDKDGNSLGLLVEEARTNIALHSNDWTNAAYSATNITAAKDATGPDGVASSASTLTADANNGTITQAITVGSAEYATSVWMKRKTGTGTVEITDNNFTNATDITSDINSSTWTQVGNITRTQANPNVGIRLGTSGDEIEVAYLQTEAGSFQTSPIPTTTASVTRNSEVIDSSDASWYNATAGSFYAQVQHLPTTLVAASEAIINAYIDGSNEWKLGISGGAAGRYRTDGRSGGSTQWGIFGDHEAGDNVTQRLAAAAQVNDVAFYIDGAAKTPDTTATMPAGSVASFDIGNDNGVEIFNGHIKEIRYYNERLANSVLEDMSNGVFP